MRWLVVCLLALSAITPHGVAAAPASPRAVNLRLADLPKGFTLKERTGDATGDNEAFANTHNLALRILAVNSDVLSFATSKLATAAYNAAAPKTAKNLKSSVFTRARALAIGAVGSHHLAYQLTGSAPGSTPTMDAVVFVRGRYFVILSVVATTRSPDPARLLTLARIVDGRIQQVG